MIGETRLELLLRPLALALRSAAAAGVPLWQKHGAAQQRLSEDDTQMLRRPLCNVGPVGDEDVSDVIVGKPLAREQPREEESVWGSAGASSRKSDGLTERGRRGDLKRMREGSRGIAADHVKPLTHRD